MSGKRRVIFLGERRLAQVCLVSLAKNYSASISLCALVSPPSFFHSAKQTFPQFLENTAHIDNSVRNEQAILEEIGRADLLISVQHPWILSASILDAVDGSALNLHNAKLPEYGGFNSISHAIILGDKNYTSTLHWMANEVDTGPIALEAQTKISGTDTAYSLYQKTIPIVESIFTEGIEQYLDGALPRRACEGGKHFFSRKSLDELKDVSSVTCSETIDRIVRGAYFPPHEPAFRCLGGGGKHFLIPEGEASQLLLALRPANLCTW